MDLVGILHHRISSEILHPRRCHTISCIALSSISLCWPQPITAVVRHVRQHAPPTYPSSAFMGSRGQRCLALSITGIYRRPAYVIT